VKLLIKSLVRRCRLRAHQIDSLPLLRPAFCEPLFGIGLSVIPPHPIVD